MEESEICLVFQNSRGEIANIIINANEFVSLGSNTDKRLEALKTHKRTPGTVKDQIGGTYKLVNIIYMPY